MSQNCFNITCMGIGFDGTLDAYLAKTDSMPNPSPHVLTALVAFHEDD